MAELAKAGVAGEAPPLSARARPELPAAATRVRRVQARSAPRRTPGPRCGIGAPRSRSCPNPALADGHGVCALAGSGGRRSLLAPPGGLEEAAGRETCGLAGAGKQAAEGGRRSAAARAPDREAGRAAVPGLESRCRSRTGKSCVGAVSGALEKISVSPSNPRCNARPGRLHYIMLPL